LRRPSGICADNICSHLLHATHLQHGAQHLGRSNHGARRCRSW
jgi:hypothetical protein